MESRNAPGEPPGRFPAVPRIEKRTIRDNCNAAIMRAAFYAQLSPVKTLQQLMADRVVCVRMLLIGLVMILCG